MVRGLVVDKKRGNILKVRYTPPPKNIHIHIHIFCIKKIQKNQNGARTHSAIDSTARFPISSRVSIPHYHFRARISSQERTRTALLPPLLTWQMDRHKYVKVAYHGFRELSRPSRLATYNNTLARDAFDEPHYALIDTLFSLAEAYLFAQLVDFADRWPDKVPARTGMQ